MNAYKTKAEVVALMEKLEAFGLYAMSGSGKFWYPAGTYYLAHGEYASPEYYPTQYKDGWAVGKQSYFYPGTYGVPEGRQRIDMEEFERELWSASAGCLGEVVNSRHSPDPDGAIRLNGQPNKRIKR